MHVGSCLIFEGKAPDYVTLIEHIQRRLEAVPRFRQKLATVPLQQGRPVWVDDPHFNIRYHVRHTALPEPCNEKALKAKSAFIFSQTLDRSKPLWEIWLIEGLDKNRFALVGKSHHCLVDGVSGVDITAVMFDLTKETPDAGNKLKAWTPRPVPSKAQLLADALIEKVETPVHAAKKVRSALQTPQSALKELANQLNGLKAFLQTAASATPDSPLNTTIGPDRRFEWAAVDLKQLKDIKNALGGTVNDVVLAAVTGALRTLLHSRGDSTDGLELKAMVPVSVHSDHSAAALGNQVTMVMAPLPVYEEDPIKRLHLITPEMEHVKDSGQAVGAKALTELTGFAPPTIAQQAARLQGRQRVYNLVVTNIPGPQFPLYLLGRKMQAIYPQIPLSQNQSVAVAVMSYNGSMYFGLIGDYDKSKDIALFAEELHNEIKTLHQLAVQSNEPKRKSTEVGDVSWIPTTTSKRRSPKRAAKVKKTSKQPSSTSKKPKKSKK